ncbi:Ubiquitin carboxyl-terminal hydrolase 2 [Cladobotryum mycophilum]|uniref:Ubiquitin carboxyl-terminal hydrolase n=1 Tax=Cladobotryum mycophilum TaxID=491253 RepID=A0ABR0SUB9_9HYPO
MTAEPGSNMPNSVEPQPAVQERRRSVRQAAALPNKIPKKAASPTISEGSSKIMGEPRRNPKRKASEAASQPPNLPDNLLEEALKPLTSEDIEEWDGWIELESEPAFFNIILRDLGVKDVKAQEIFTIDQTSLDILPKPVFGLIFLFQYAPGRDEGGGEEETGSLWFANQTTNNACATVALLNIVMNANGVELGHKLREFRESTKDLSTTLRGHQLSKNSFIRAIHNSFTRRMDHLNADLALENEATDAKSTIKRRAPKKGIKSNARKKKKVDDDYGYHFIAYIPADGFVWELDGLRSKPHKLGPIDPEDSWTSIARPQIEARMLQYEESQLSFNLLALCQSPLALHSRGIAQALAAVRYMRNHMRDSPGFANLVSNEDPVLDIKNSQQLSEFNLNRSHIEDAEIPDSLKHRIARLEIGDAYDLYQQLVVDVKATIGEFRAELIALAEDEQRVKGRKKDYGQALHKWVQKLAEKGVLEEVIESS